MKVLLPGSLPITPVPRPGTEFHTIDVTAPVPREHLDAEVLVVWGQPTHVLVEAARTMGHLRLVQALAAGPDNVVEAGFAPGVVIASGVGLHDVAVAEHALALSLAAVRSLHTLVRAQIGHRWASEFGWAPASALSSTDQHGSTDLPAQRGPFNSLYGRRVLIWGFGSIGRHLAPMFTQLGARVTGVARTPGTRDGYQVLADSDLDAALPTADLVVMILPHTPATHHALGAHRLALLAPHAWLVNVGRGTTVDTEALVAALQQGRFAGAALDVFETEPLPATSPLWDMPQVILTPHAAGGRPLGAAQLLDSQLTALATGAPLRNVLAH